MVLIIKEITMLTVKDKIEYTKKFIGDLKHDMVTDDLNTKYYIEIIIPDLEKQREDYLALLEKNSKKKKGKKGKEEAEAELAQAKVTSKADIDSAKQQVENWKKSLEYRKGFLKIAERELAELTKDSK